MISGNQGLTRISKQAVHDVQGILRLGESLVRSPFGVEERYSALLSSFDFNIITAAASRGLQLRSGWPSDTRLSRAHYWTTSVQPWAREMVFLSTVILPRVCKRRLNTTTCLSSSLYRPEKDLLLQSMYCTRPTTGKRPVFPQVFHEVSWCVASAWSTAQP